MKANNLNSEIEEDLEEDDEYFDEIDETDETNDGLFQQLRSIFSKASLGLGSVDDNLESSLKDVIEKSSGFVRKYPLQCLFAALALGFLIGRTSAKKGGRK